jgi:hypothetical protein
MVNCDAEKFILKSIAGLDSQSNARNTINDNFSKIADKIRCIGSKFGDYLPITPPNPPVRGEQYSVVYNGSSYYLQPSSAAKYGTKFIIRENESILVEKDYQYIVKNNLEVYGDFILEAGAELVIL